MFILPCISFRADPCSVWGEDKKVTTLKLPPLLYPRGAWSLLPRLPAYDLAKPCCHRPAQGLGLCGICVIPAGPKTAWMASPCTVASMASGSTSQQQQKRPKTELIHYLGRCNISTGQRDKTLNALFYENFPKNSTAITLLMKLMPVLATQTHVTARGDLVREQLDNSGVFNHPCLLNCIPGHSASFLKQPWRCNHLTAKSHQG